MKSPIVSILVINYKTKELTEECLKSISLAYPTQLKNGEFEFLVLDNGSNDESLEYLKKFANSFPGIYIVESKENLGFAKGQNFLAKKAKGEYLFFLNSDVKVKDSGLLGTISYLENSKEVGILGAKLIRPNGSVEKSTGSFYTPFNLVLVMLGFERFGLVRKSYSHIQKVDWVSGGAMMVKKSVFDELNGFDEHYFMYVEDMDLCYRARKKNIEVVYFPDFVIDHMEHGSSNRDYAILNIYKGILHFYKENRSYSEYLFAKNLLFLKAFLLSLMGSKVYRENTKIV